jgi:hypothetical protein
MGSSTFATSRSQWHLGAARYVSEIRDPFDNVIEFDAFRHRPTDGVSNSSRLQVPVIAISRSPRSGDQHARDDEFHRRVWTYVTEASGVSGHHSSSVVPPVNRRRNTVRRAELTALLAPAGGRGLHLRPSTDTQALTQSSRVVATRAVSGWGVFGWT